ncbi:hypothetical protein IT418_01255 [bacterium]|nr:hypothetical protein [bacterium]
MFSKKNINDIPMEETPHGSGSRKIIVPTYKDFLNKLETYSNNHDWPVCFDWGKLHNQDSQNGHICVLDCVNLQHKTIRVVDPDYFSSKWQIHSIKKMYDAMVFHGKGNSAGIWELEKV